MRKVPTAMPMETAMEMGIAVTPTAADTDTTTTLERAERNDKGKRRMKSEALVSGMGPGDWRSRMERTAQQQARKLAQLHRTIAKMAIMLETQTALQEAQWPGIETWLEEKEDKWNMYHQDDVLWGKRIADMITRVIAATERGQREERQADTKGVELEDSIHADLTQKGGLKKPEERQQLQPGRQLKSKPKPKPKPNPAPTPKPTPTPTLRTRSTVKGVTTSGPTPTIRWETVAPRNQKPLASLAPAPALTTGSRMADRRLILR